MKNIVITLLFLSTTCFCDILSTSGKIRFDTQMDGQAEMTLNSTGLGIGILPSSNLHVSGNAMILKQLFVGGTSGSANLNVIGTIGYGVETLSSNTTLGDSTVVLVDSSSGNMTLTLPYAGNVLGREYQIKKISTSYSVWISGGGNLIDDTSPIELPESSDLASVKLISDGRQWHKIDQKDILETVSSDNLVGWWKFNENSGAVAFDSSSRGNNGSLVGSLNFSDNVSFRNSYQTLTFDGVDDGISVGQIMTATPNELTISFWINKNTQSGWNTIVEFDTPPNSIYIENKHNAAAIIVGVYVGTNGNAWASQTIEATLGVVDSVWSFVTITLNSTTLSIYLNGSLDNSYSGIYTFDMAQALNNFYIGGISRGYLKGEIGDIKVYDIILTPSDILALFDEGF